MTIIAARNLNDAVNLGLSHLYDNGIEEKSRNGSVLVAPAPVMTEYALPKEHVLFGATRDANPFFHLMEALWMLAGRNDLAFPVQFNKRFAEYSDDGETIHGAYGFRWRRFFDCDQLRELVDELKKNPNSRRAVLTMWSPYGDLTPIVMEDDGMGEAIFGGLTSKDVPCNTHAYFDLRGGVLNMTVCNRSNDAIWGAYGANAVHFSILLEYMAEQLGVPMGVYRQFSNNFHAYTDVYGKAKLSDIAIESRSNNYYLDGMPTIPLGSDTIGWMDELREFLEFGSVKEDSDATFLRTVAQPMYAAWFDRKEKGWSHARNILESMPRCDWKLASIEWLYRRKEQKDVA